MMSLSFTRTTSWLLIGEIVLLALIVLSVLRLSEARAGLVDSSRNHQACAQLAGEIETLREMASVASDGQEKVRFDNSQWITLARKCGMRENQVASIQRPTQIDGTDYQRQDTAIDLDAVTMEQLIRLSIMAESLSSSAKITSINLVSNRQSTARQRSPSKAAELWNAQLILTQLDYTARSARR